MESREPVTESSNQKRQLDDVSSAAEKRPIQRHLMLHCVDGCVPFLNPAQLEKYFPPSSGLWLGLAVQDTCVRPVLEKPNDKTTTKKKQSNKHPTAPKEAQKDKHKVRGYTFSPVSPDPWLLPYTRVTVPCFYETDSSRTHDAKNPRKQKKQTSHKALYVWTPHGRQPLTPDAYATAALHGLNSPFTTALCDGDDKEGASKRKNGTEESSTRSVLGRNELWYRHLMEALTAVGRTKGSENSSLPGVNVWKPILLPPVESQSGTASSCRDDENESSDAKLCNGMVFVGQWQPRLFNEKQQPNNKWRVILSTSSLLEVLGILSEGFINVIGTSLPTHWAKNKMALGLDLSGYNRDAKKRQKVVEQSSNGSTVSALNFDGCRDISDKSYADDTKPLVEGCVCMTCKASRFSRAYIHHLVCAKEMLADILIFGHNLHHLLRLIDLFNSVNAELHVDLKSYIESQLPVFEVAR